jgi:hypothetical protein
VLLRLCPSNKKQKNDLTARSKHFAQMQEMVDPALPSQAKESRFTLSQESILSR